MGHFATSIHFSPRDDAFAALRPRVEAMMRRAGFRPTEPGETPDRELIVLQGKFSPSWVSLYDSSAEAQDETNERLAAALSLEFKVPAVAMLVHDSDVREVALLQSGKKRDAFRDWLGYFSCSPAESRALRGDASKWARAFERPDLEAALGARFTPSDGPTELLTQVAEALGLDAALANAGFNQFFGSDDLPLQHALRLTAFEEAFSDMPPDALKRQLLSFRQVEDSLEALRVDGPPDLWWGTPHGPPGDDATEEPDWESRRECRLQKGTSTGVGETAFNRGGEGGPLVLEVRGSALDAGLVAVKSVSAFRGSLNQRLEAAATVEFDQLHVGAGLSDETQGWSLKGPRAEHFARERSAHFSVTLDGLKAGKGQLELWAGVKDPASPRRLRLVAIVVEEPAKGPTVTRRPTLKRR